MKIDQVKKYLISSVKMPFYMFISDNMYKNTMGELSILGFDFIRMSSFCSSEDRIPDVDAFLSYISTAVENEKGKRIVVTGLGEFLALSGIDVAARILSRLKDLNIGDAKVVLLLRGLSSLIPRFESDPRFDNRRFDIVGKAECRLSFILTAQAASISGLSGFKAMLAELENGRTGNIVVKTTVNIEKAIFTVHQIRDAYEGVKFVTMDFDLARSSGNDTYWAELLAELSQGRGSIDEIFREHGFYSNLESSFYLRISGRNYRNWLYFIFLKIKVHELQSIYLKMVLNETDHFENLFDNILNMIIEIPLEDQNFTILYQERKSLIEKFPESDLAGFIVNNRKKMSESIYRLTDNTKVERQEIVSWVSRNGIIPQLDYIYPELAAYMRKYIFTCSEIDNLLTKYFEAYKWQKVNNSLDTKFLDEVDDLALSRVFNRLPTRDEILDSVDRNDTFLYWLDAFGVEYLSLVETLTQKRGLSAKISVARAELPTITSINRGFFDEWQGHKDKNDELDSIKHSNTGGYIKTGFELSSYLAEELDIITAMLDKAKTELALRHCKRFLIVSDHGASRLAVLRHKEEKYDTDTTGEHSGRCCETFVSYDLPFAVEENGYLVLADYGRFKGSRAANIEVHGGASLEEVVVPVIELSLRDWNITAKLVDEIVSVDFRAGTEIMLFINSPVQSISVVLHDKHYQAIQIDSNHYSVKLPDTKRAGTFQADVYTGNDLIGKVIFTTQGKGFKINREFDEIF